MEISVSYQTLSFFISILTGGIIGVVYDAFRIIRIVKTPSDIRAFFEDILFWIICFFITFYLLIKVSAGSVRWFLILGELLGFVIYYHTLGALIYKESKIIINFSKRVVKAILKVVLWPFIKIFVFFEKIFKKLFKFLKKHYIIFISKRKNKGNKKIRRAKNGKKNKEKKKKHIG